MKLADHIRNLAEAAGCAGFGITTASAFEDVAATIAERRDGGLGGKLRFTYQDPETAADVRRSFPWAQRLVVISWPYMPDAGNPGPAATGTGRIARFAGVDQYEGLRRSLDTIAERLREQGWRAAVLADDNRLVDRAAAVRAGVGWWGKSTMVLDPRHGPWLLLGSVVTDAELPTTSAMVRDCGTCDACLPACPTGAIIAPGVLDAAQCLAHWMQTAGVIPEHLRTAMGDRVYGCDDCLDACPPGMKRMAEADRGRGRIDLEGLLAADDSTLLTTYAHFYMPKRNPKFLRRNALIALGNSVAGLSNEQAEGSTRNTEAIGVIAGYLGHPDDVLRSHAAWALGRIGGRAGEALLEFQRDRERSGLVLGEIEKALATIRDAPR